MTWALCFNWCLVFSSMGLEVCGPRMVIQQKKHLEVSVPFMTSQKLTSNMLCLSPQVLKDGQELIWICFQAINMHYCRKWIIHVNLWGIWLTQEENVLCQWRGPKTVSKAPVHRLTCRAAIVIGLFKVSRPLTYRSPPLLPPEGLCFPRGPRSGFHHLANKAACNSPQASTQWGNMTPFPSDWATFLTSKGNIVFVKVMLMWVYAELS